MDFIQQKSEISKHESSDCIFCKIIKGKIPCNKVYEDDKVLAFLDIAPNAKGHTLVVPKTHTENLLDTPTKTLSAILFVAKKLGRPVMNASGCTGFNFTQNNFKSAGQDVFHIHFHIIPRVEGDNLKNWPHTSYDDGEAKEMAAKISQNL